MNLHAYMGMLRLTRNSVGRARWQVILTVLFPIFAHNIASAQLKLDASEGSVASSPEKHSFVPSATRWKSLRMARSSRFETTVAI